MQISKIKKTYNKIIKLDDYTWSFVGRFFTDNYSSRLIEIEQKNGRSDETQSFGEAYDMICAYNDDIEKITITAEALSSRFSLTLINTKKIFRPSLVINADWQYGFQKEQIISFTDSFLALADMGEKYSRKKNSFIYFTGVFAGSIFFNMILYEKIISGFSKFLVVSLFLFCLFPVEWLWKRLIYNPSGILFATDEMRCTEYEEKVRTEKIVKRILFFVLLALIVVISLMDIMS